MILCAPNGPFVLDKIASLDCQSNAAVRVNIVLDHQPCEKCAYDLHKLHDFQINVLVYGKHKQKGPHANHV